MKRETQKIEYDLESGYHNLVLGSLKIPLFFSGMLTGQRALDNGSFERLKWHIKKAVET